MNAHIYFMMDIHCSELDCENPLGAGKVVKYFILHVKKYNFTPIILTRFCRTFHFAIKMIHY